MPFSSKSILGLQVYRLIEDKTVTEEKYKESQFYEKK